METTTTETHNQPKCRAVELSPNGHTTFLHVAGTLLKRGQKYCKSQIGSGVCSWTVSRNVSGVTCKATWLPKHACHKDNKSLLKWTRPQLYKDNYRRLWHAKCGSVLCKESTPATYHNLPWKHTYRWLYTDQVDRTYVFQNTHIRKHIEQQLMKIVMKLKESHDRYREALEEGKGRRKWCYLYYNLKD